MMKNAACTLIVSWVMICGSFLIWPTTNVSAVLMDNEVENTFSWSITNAPLIKQNDGKTQLTLSIRYQSELGIQPNSYPLKFVKYTIHFVRIGQTNGFVNSVGQNTLQIILQQNGPQFDPETFAMMTIYLEDGRPIGAYGRVKVGGETVYNSIIQNQQDLMDSKEYTLTVTLLDSGQNTDSHIGAAMIYDTMWYCRWLIPSGMPAFANVNWPVGWQAGNGEESFFENGEIYISEDLFKDDDTSSLYLGLDVLRHNCAHFLQYTIALSSLWWPSSDSWGEHDWEYEMQGVGEADTAELAFLDGFADAFAVYAGFQNEAPNDLLYTPTHPEGFHIESYPFDGRIYGNDENPGIRGERTEGCIASLIWDIIDNANVHDETFGNDDDQLSISFFDLWANVFMSPKKMKTVLDFWDNLNRFYTSNDGFLSELMIQDIFFANNVARFSYSFKEEPSQHGTNGIEYSNFEILGSNTPVWGPIAGQKLLVRYVLINNNDDDVYFSPNEGYGIAIRDMFGRNYDPQRNGNDIPAHSCAIYFKTISLNNVGDHIFWPSYTFQGDRQEPFQWDHQTVKMDDNVLMSIDLSKGFPSDWSNFDLNSKDWNKNNIADFDYWDVVTLPGGENAVWCAENQAGHGNKVNNRYFPEMDSCMRKYGDFRVIGLRLSFSYSLSTFHSDDYLAVDYGDIDGNIHHIVCYTESTNGFVKNTVVYLNKCFQRTDDMRFQFNFFSCPTNHANCPIGAHIKDIQILAG